jgi:hypothetical protein
MAKRAATFLKGVYEAGAEGEGPTFSVFWSMVTKGLVCRGDHHGIFAFSSTGAVARNCRSGPGR